MNKIAKLLSFIIVLSMVVTHIVVFPVEVIAIAMGQYIIGDGSGGGGGGTINGAGGSGGNGGGSNDTITGTKGNDVIFGDGSGGGASGRGIGADTITYGGLGGSGNDYINGSDGDDLIFGDGFNGQNSYTWQFGGRGGLGGGGGGATGGWFGAQSTAGAGGIGAGGGGGGTINGQGGGTLISGIGSIGFNNGGNGGNSASTKDGITGLGGSGSNFSGGGGAGFGGAAGGVGTDGSASGSPSISGKDGDTNEHRYNDSNESIRNYLSEQIIRTILTNYPEYGAGNDIINGGSGSNELFGLGGSDTFIVNSADNATRSRIWDFKSGDIIQLKTENSFVSTEAMGSILSMAATIDLDGDGQNDDTRLVFSGCNIDLVNVSPTNLRSGENGIYLTNTAPVLSIADDSLLLSIPSQTNSIQIDPSGKLIDADGDNHWHHGKLSVQITSDATTSDVFSILDNNNTSPNITTVQGNTILSNANQVIGRFSLANGGVNGSTQLEICFFSTATNEIVQEVMRSIQFSTSEKGTGTRTISIRATDLAGAYSEDSRTIVIDVQDYDISFNSNGGSAISPIKADYNTLITSPTSPSKTGYSFAGWYRDMGLATAWNFTVDRVPSSDLVLHAKWTINEYTVTFKNYDGSVIDTQVVTHGSSATVPATPIRTGYTFAAWDRSLSNITSNTEVTATYTANTNTAYKVEHYKQDLNGTYVKAATDNLTGTTGAAVTAAVKTYSGLRENVNHTSRVSSGTISADGSTVLKLYYDRNEYTVSFINHNSEVLSPEDVLYGGKASVPTKPTRAFHTFAGWFTDNETFSNEWSFTDNQVTGNINLYAKWTRIPQSINRVNVDPETTITVNGLNDKVRLPEADNANTADIVVFVKAEPTKVPEIIKDKAAAEMSKKGLTMLNVFDIGLYKRITTYEGVTSESEISNSDITGKITVQIPLTEEQAKKDNLAIAYVDDAGNVTIIPGKIVAVGSSKYFEFETDHFSMYSLVEIAEVTIPKTGEKPYAAIGLALLVLAAAVDTGKRRFRQEYN